MFFKILICTFMLMKFSRYVLIIFLKNSVQYPYVIEILTYALSICPLSSLFPLFLFFLHFFIPFFCFARSFLFPLFLFLFSPLSSFSVSAFFETFPLIDGYSFCLLPSPSLPPSPCLDFTNHLCLGLWLSLLLFLFLSPASSPLPLPSIVVSRRCCCSFRQWFPSSSSLRPLLDCLWPLCSFAGVSVIVARLSISVRPSD